MKFYFISWTSNTIFSLIFQFYFILKNQHIYNSGNLYNKTLEKKVYFLFYVNKFIKPLFEWKKVWIFYCLVYVTKVIKTLLTSEHNECHPTKYMKRQTDSSVSWNFMSGKTYRKQCVHYRQVMSSGCAKINVRYMYKNNHSIKCQIYNVYVHYSYRTKIQITFKTYTHTRINHVSIKCQGVKVRSIRGDNLKENKLFNLFQICKFNKNLVLWTKTDKSI